MRPQRFDIAIIGSGFAGSLLAMIARRLGRSVVLLEKGSHPRIVIGESSTPLANLLLEELVDRYDLPQLRPFCKWGSWQKAHPEVACGLKRGFTFYHHDLDRPAPAVHDRERQLLVAASPADEIADTHWYRADVDAHFVSSAVDCGVTYLDHVQLDSPEFDRDVVRLSGRRGREPVTFEADFVVDASGPRGFLHSSLPLTERDLPGYPRTHALYSHFRGVERLGAEDGAPYPVDDAAVHHVFDRGWIWVLRFNNGVTSAGVAATEELAGELRFSECAPAWQRLIAALPDLRRQFAHAQPLYEFRHIPNLSFRSGQITGERWALLPSAAGFVDPLLSTGFPLTLFGIERLAQLMETGKLHDPGALSMYAEETDQDLLATAHLTAALYSSMNDFPTFTARTMLYFAAASYSESARRLGNAHLAPGFLLRKHPVFGERMRELAEAPPDANLAQEIREGIQPFNVAGLSNPARRNWYPALAEDLIESAHKLGATEDEVVAMLKRCGFNAPQPVLQ
jgi:FADH2 O2-dependent halogenase